ncbi:DMT family transporter [Patescibacteria group bacterium]|nr:DMT family transporter [Patescibacteria group bacterium]
MLIPFWIILAAVAGLGSNIINFFSRYILKDNGDSTTWAWTFEFLKLLFFIPFLFFDFKFEFHLKSILFLLGAGLTEFISVYLFMKMHKYSHLSVSTILSRTRLIWVPILAFLFFGERLTNLQYIGVAILFIGLSIVVAPHKFFLDKGAIYANTSAIIIALNTILLKQAVAFASTPVIMIFYSLPSVILFPIFMKNTKQRLFNQNLDKKLPKLLGVGANVAALFLLIAALKIGDVSRVNALYQGMLVVNVLAGIILLKERQDILRKLLGTAVTIIGIILLA